MKPTVCFVVACLIAVETLFAVAVFAQGVAPVTSRSEIVSGGKNREQGRATKREDRRAVTLAKSRSKSSFRIIAPSDPRKTTHQLTSGKLKIGITANGGGVINQLIIPGLGDIMGDKTDMYGRSGQSSIRSMSHSGKYNPTQAGFNERLGTRCEIIERRDKLIVAARGCALWKADGKYDYTEWENIGSDSYDDDNRASDRDGLDEKNLKGKQATEVHSEFDYYGEYENLKGKKNIAIATIRHYFEYRFIRSPGHCLNQFSQETPIYDPKAAVPDISVKEPSGVFAGTDSDLHILNSAWSIRNDLPIWHPKYRFVKKIDRPWESMERRKVFRGDASKYEQAFIVSDSNDPDKGHALAFYRPQSDINRYPVIGVHERSKKIVYKDARTVEAYINDTPTRTDDMSWMGFKHHITGMINRDRLPEGVYETYRAEYYLIYGTPREIVTSLSAIYKLNRNKQ